MPIYEYECENCGNIFELIQKFKDIPIKKCKCGGTVNKVIHGSYIKFVGSGWFCNDNKPESKKKEQKQEQEKNSEI